MTAQPARPLREILVARAGEMADGDRRIVVADNVEVGVFRVDGTYYAWRNQCPHQGGPICQGRLMKRVEERLDDERRSLGIHYVDGTLNLVCPWHGYEFDLRTGRHVGLPSIRLLACKVTLRDGEVYVVV